MTVRTAGAERWIAYDVKSSGFHFRPDKGVPGTMRRSMPAPAADAQTQGRDLSAFDRYAIHTGGPRVHGLSHASLSNPGRHSGGSPLAIQHDGDRFISIMLWSVDSTAREPLVEQIASSVRLALVGGQLTAGERLPAARELAEVLEVNANTVLAAYRILREEEIVEFRRGRGVRVRPTVDAPAIARSAVVQAARTYLDQGLRHGWDVHELADLLRELG